ncbi:MAG: radical SAM protein [Lachnospiraceae bacterium]|nr:radical SAM protein [Lachnospiraceae bacterium]
MISKPLILAVDMHGCPNRCKHCWNGHMPNREMEEDADIWLVNYFKPYFNSITYYSWLREPDYCDDYTQRWSRDNQISVNATPERFELASFWRIVRDPNYVAFLKEVGVHKVQLTFFGMEEMTDKYTGRKGAFKELLDATEILIANQIAPRWQAFINEENKGEIVQLLDLVDTLRLKERCSLFQEDFKFFVHSGSCDGENRKLYDVRIEKKHIPEVLIPYYMDYEKVLTERKCCYLLMNDTSNMVYYNEDSIVLNISNTYDVYFNFTHMSEEWKIGNLKIDSQEEIIRRIIEEDIPALNLAREITVKELVTKYGNKQSDRAFLIGDYKSYLLNCYLEDEIG